MLQKERLQALGHVLLHELELLQLLDKVGVELISVVEQFLKLLCHEVRVCDGNYVFQFLMQHAHVVFVKFLLNLFQFLLLGGLVRRPWWDPLRKLTELIRCKGSNLWSSADGEGLIVDEHRIRASIEVVMLQDGIVTSSVNLHYACQPFLSNEFFWEDCVWKLLDEVGFKYGVVHFSHAHEGIISHVSMCSSLNISRRLRLRFLP